MRNNKSIMSQIATDVVTMCKKTLGRFYFENANKNGYAANDGIYILVPTIVLHSTEREVCIFWGRWGFVFWYGKYHV